MSKPCAKYDEILKRDLRPRERLDEARANIQFAVKFLESFERKLSCVHDEATEEALLALCAAADNALYAAENAAFIGSYGYEAQPVKMVKWDRDRHCVLLVNE